jgi:hypothetical protein
MRSMIGGLIATIPLAGANRVIFTLYVGSASGAFAYFLALIV